MSISKSLSRAIAKNDQMPENFLPYLREIAISISGIRASFNLCHKKMNLDAKFLIKKAMAIEAHNISGLLSGAGLSKDTVFKVYGKNELIEMRNSICHVEQRIEMESAAPRSAPKKLEWETEEVAGGLGLSPDGGKTWNFSGSVYGFNFSGGKGVKTTVGMVNEFLVCQSEQGCISLDLGIDNFDKLYHALYSSIENIRR